MMNWTKITNYTAMGLVSLLALGAFVLSYVALYDIAVKYGLPDYLAWIWPLLIDGSIIVFTIAVIRATLHQEKSWWPWTLVGVFTFGTIAFNALHSNHIPVPDNYVSIVVFIVPPIALVLAFETAMAMLRSTVARNSLIQSLAELTQQFAQKTRELAEFEATRRAEIEAEGQRARLNLDNELNQLGQQIEARRLEVANLESEKEQQVSQLQDQIETMERTIQSYQQDIEAKQKELKSLDNNGQVKLYLPVNLSPEQRQELVNRMGQEGLTQEQMAKALGVSVGTIKNIKKANEVATNGRVS
jgi:DNA-directed RNA polymerase specialized sigma24 family protein